jgi:hypothetical protein
VVAAKNEPTTGDLLKAINPQSPKATAPLLKGHGTYAKNKVNLIFIITKPTFSAKFCGENFVAFLGFLWYSI